MIVFDLRGSMGKSMCQMQNNNVSYLQYNFVKGYSSRRREGKASEQKTPGYILSEVVSRAENMLIIIQQNNHIGNYFIKL